ncbi:MAG: hypothetical protein LBS41_04670, partial [Streptococcaceae bacterium]|nr:hypothetical protein [Streptococcaceae bacterium]
AQQERLFILYASALGLLWDYRRFLKIAFKQQIRFFSLCHSHCPKSTNKCRQLSCATVLQKKQVHSVNPTEQSPLDLFPQMQKKTPDQKLKSP